MNTRIGFSTAALLAAIAPAALAQTGTEVNVSGATLFDAFFEAQASTQDYLDLDADGRVVDFNAGNFDQLRGSYFDVQYRGVGSGNGLAELVNYGEANFTGSKTWTDLGTASQGSFQNGSSVAGSSFFGDAKIGLAVSDVPATWFVTQSGTGKWDAAPASVGYGNSPTVSNPVGIGTGNSAGGQSNKLKSLTPSDPTSGTTTLNFDGSVPAAQVFEYQVAWVPIAFIANHGTAIDADNDGTVDGNVTKSALQHLYVTGRMDTGENLVAITRDSGSGTRNGAMNSLGVDPSWGVGDNLGQKNGGSSDDATEFLGDEFVPTNKGSSSRLEAAVENNRLGVGYNGLVGGSKAGNDSLSNNHEILNVMNDIAGGTEYVRPVMDGNVNHNNVVFNGDADTGWQVGGSESFYTIGSALSEDIYVATQSINVGGNAYQPGDIIAANDVATLTSNFTEDTDKRDGTINGDFYKHAGDGSGDSPMVDQAGALYLRNILTSIDEFVSANDTGEELDETGSPGQALASQFSLVQSVEALPSAANAGVFEANAGEVESLQDPNVLPLQDLADTYGSVGYGKVSKRKDGTTYSDGVVGGGNYVTNDGTTVMYLADMSSNLSTVDDVNGDGNKNQADIDISERNAIAGDFNYDGLRTAADIAGMVSAFENVNNRGAIQLPGGATDNHAVLELLADFDGDGNFDIDDVRYGADGLFIREPSVVLVNSGTTNPRVLNRKQNFIDVDNASNSGNLFSTILATDKEYEAGDSRGDVAGNDLTKGFKPSGADGTVDAQDIDYVFAQFASESDWGDGDGIAEWIVLDEAVNFDLSADMDGDLDVDQDDVQELVTVVLGTEFGDANLDGVIDFLDVSSVSAGFGTQTGWSGGDFNGDGAVDFLDVSILSANFGFNAAVTAEGLVALAELQAVAVPEPGTLLALGAAGAGLIGRRRRK